MLLGPLAVFSLAQDIEQTPEVEIFRDLKGITMVFVLEGHFEMGISIEKAVDLCKELKITDGYPSCNIPYVTNARQDPIMVEVEAFYMDQYEVSRANYIACVDADVCDKKPLMYQPSKPLDVPVQNASYYDAAIYCAWRGARIPTETEWEYASRGSDSLNFPWGNEFNGDATNHCDLNCKVLGDMASFSVWNDGYSELAPVDTFEKGQSWAGIYNLGGNILEWTSTRSEFNQSSYDDLRVIKGGSYDTYPYQTAGWFRDIYNSSVGRANIGFRCIRTTKP
jgi:formylglycine-generating enzyme required for sulfatase activity